MSQKKERKEGQIVVRGVKSWRNAADNLKALMVVCFMRNCQNVSGILNFSWGEESHRDIKAPRINSRQACSSIFFIFLCVFLAFFLLFLAAGRDNLGVASTFK